MLIIRFAGADGVARCGLLDDGGAITDCGAVATIAELLQLRREELDELVAATAAREPTHRVEDVVLLPPIDGRTEVWAAGVTYLRSREARVEESTEKSVYERVYDAERPELFLKAVPWRVVTDGEPIAVRADSPLNVPEPELGLIVNRHAEIVGYVVIDDVSSRSIEGENPLYLPQAKIYAGSAALSVGIRPASEVPAATDLAISMTVRRDGAAAYTAQTSTVNLRRTPEELVDHLFRGMPFPHGAVLATGTGIVPGMEFTLAAGDVVEIDIAGVGTLANPVVAGTDALDWLVDAADTLTARPGGSLRTPPS